MPDPRDPSWIFEAYSGSKPIYHDRVLQGLARRRGTLVELSNGLRNEEVCGGTLTARCWRRVNSILAEDDDLIVGWWTGWNMKAHLIACFGFDSFEYSAVRASDLEWDVWRADVSHAEQCGTILSHFQSPNLWFPPTRQWVALGTPTRLTTYLVAPLDVADLLESDPELVVSRIPER